MAESDDSNKQKRTSKHEIEDVTEDVPEHENEESPVETSTKLEGDQKMEQGPETDTKVEISDSAFLELDPETERRMKKIAEQDAREAEAEEELKSKEVGIFAVKTSIGHEKMVANWLQMRAHKRKLEIYAILSPPKLRGYLLLEGVDNREALQDLIKGVQHARSVVDGVSTIEEIEHFLTPKPLVSGIEEGDVVEIIAGPFKGEKAKVTQIDEGKEEITVELFEAMVSIPVTIRGDHVRILEKERRS